MKSVYWVLILVALISLIGVFILWYQEENKPFKIAYFHGGRTVLLYRAYINESFERSNINVELWTKDLHDQHYEKIPKKYEDIKKEAEFGKVTGTELVDEVLKGNAEAASIGETAFLLAVDEGVPIVAVAELGHDTKEMPGHAVIFRSGILINSSQDIKGKVLGSRRSAGGDTVFLREFLVQEGLDPDKDVTILENLFEDKLHEYLKDGTIDGGYFHLMSLRRLIRLNEATLYRPLDWINPEASLSLLVVHRDLIERKPERIAKVVEAYLSQDALEKSLTPEERRNEPGWDEQKGLEIETDFLGLNLPQYDLPPVVNIKILNEVQDLLHKHKLINTTVDLTPYIDNSFVERAYAKMEAS